MASNRIGSRINRLEELLQYEKGFDKTINSMALDIVLRTSDTELLRSLANDYQDESKDTALKEVNARINHYQKLINKHIKQKIVRDVYLKKTSDTNISNQEYCDVLSVIDSGKHWRIKNKAISSNIG